MNKKVIFIAFFILDVVILQGCETSQWRWNWPREETPAKELTCPVHRALREMDDWTQKNVW